MVMDLRTLIATTKGARSYAELSRETVGVLADRPNEPAVKTSRFGQLGVDPLVQPTNVETVKGVAAALDVPEGAVWTAVGVSLGIAVEGSRLADLMPPGADDLPESAIAALRHVVAELVRLHRTAAG